MVHGRHFNQPKFEKWDTMRLLLSDAVRTLSDLVEPFVKRIKERRRNSADA